MDNKMEHKIEKELLEKVLRSFLASYTASRFQHEHSVRIAIQKARAHVMKKFAAPEEEVVTPEFSKLLSKNSLLLRRQDILCSLGHWRREWCEMQKDHKKYMFQGYCANEQIESLTTALCAANFALGLDIFADTQCVPAWSSAGCSCQVN